MNDDHPGFAKSDEGFGMLLNLPHLFFEQEVMFTF